MPLNHILRKCIGKYKLHKSLEKNQTPNVRWRHQTASQKWKRIENPNLGSEDIQSKYRDKIFHRKTCHANNGRQKTTNDERNRNTKSRKNQNTWRKGNLLGNLEVDTIKHTKMTEKILKEYLRRTRKLLETKLHRRNMIKGINISAVPVVRYSGPFLEWTRDKPENTKTHDDT